jgi:hypothetical protein
MAAVLEGGIDGGGGHLRGPSKEGREELRQFCF